MEAREILGIIAANKARLEAKIHVMNVIIFDNDKHIGFIFIKFVFLRF